MMSRLRSSGRRNLVIGIVGMVALSAMALVGSLHYGQTEAAEPAKSPAAAAAPAMGSAITAASLETRFSTQIKPLLQKHCSSCHTNGKHKGELSLDPYTNLVSVQRARDQWSHISETLKQKLMPPEEKPQPSQAEFDTLATWISDALNFCDCTGPRDPGRVAIHRLNRTEYNNTVRDLLGVDFKPAKDFPADDTGYGFDNIADVLTMSPLLAEKYLAAAEQVMEKVIPSENPNRSRVKRYGDTALKATGDKNQPTQLVGPGDSSCQHEFIADGSYEIRIRSFQRRVGADNAKLLIKVDGKEAGTVEVTGARDKPATARVRTDVKAGSHRVAVSLANPKSDANPDTKKVAMRSVSLEWIEVDGPSNAVAPPPSAGYRRIFIAQPSAKIADEVAAKAILQRFLTRAYRRPSQTDEVESLLKVFRSAKTDGENFEQSIRYCLTAVLVSPQFLFRIEVDPPGAGSNAANPVPYAISDYELAARLSYFLWSSAPDDELLGFAMSKRLRDPQVLEQQVRRMMQDPRSIALVENFAGQWLELRNLDDYKPDTAVFPAWDDKLRVAMKRETELFFDNVIREDRSVLELLSADYTFVNERLARHYGLAGVTGDQFRRVSLVGTKRGGILTQASVLTVTGMTTRTSPVKRGKFILENVLGTPPPPPPADVPALSDQAKDISKATLRVRLEEHRKDPNCAICHVRMDGIGFSLENFDAIGAWRDKDGKFPIDSIGKLPEGTVLNGPEGLKQMLGKRQGDFVGCLVKKMLTYSLGRGVEYYDQCTVKDIEQSVRQNNYKFSSLVLTIVKSDAFTKRRLLRPDEMHNKQEKVLDIKDKKK